MNQSMKDASYIPIAEACVWASAHTNKIISRENISYLIQYGKIKSHKKEGVSVVDKHDLEAYYAKHNRSNVWRTTLGEDVDWNLAFDTLREKDTTKHVHRLHPYKGKFIPQLVEHFLSPQFGVFSKNDLILDPFCGSGTTLVQANELDMHAVGIDVSLFNVLLSNAKLSRVPFRIMEQVFNDLTQELENFLIRKDHVTFENELHSRLSEWNRTFFPVPEFIHKVKRSEVHEMIFGKEKAEEFKILYDELLSRYGIDLHNKSGGFLEKWLVAPIYKEVLCMKRAIHNIADEALRTLAFLVLSRTVRSCRATTHADLSTLKHPIHAPYYCRKHHRVCRPLFSMRSWWKRYSRDMIDRFYAFEQLRTDTHQIALCGDAREIDIHKRLSDSPIANRKIDGIFTSPPYVGLIDYHEQHAYAYELLELSRNDNNEIGPLRNGQGREARERYVKGITDVLLNCKTVMKETASVFIVANDKYNLYPEIAKKAGFAILKVHKRPVLNRSEKNRNSAYSESIFQLKMV